MKFKKYIAASMIALAGLTACSDSFLDIDYTEYLDEEAAGEAAGQKSGRVFERYVVMDGYSWSNQHFA